MILLCIVSFSNGRRNWRWEMGAATISEVRISDERTDGGAHRDCCGEGKGKISRCMLEFLLIGLDGDDNSVLDTVKQGEYHEGRITNGSNA